MISEDAPMNKAYHVRRRADQLIFSPSAEWPSLKLFSSRPHQEDDFVESLTPRWIAVLMLARYRSSIILAAWF